jgi:hypothetical protein
MVRVDPKKIEPEISDELWEELMEDYNSAFLRPPNSMRPHQSVIDYAMDVDPEKSSGMSAMYRPGSKREWTTTNGMEELSYLARCRTALRMAWGAPTMSYMSPWQLMRAGLSDARVLFIKSEPHSSKKQTSKRWRLIWAASIVDAACTAIASRDQDKIDIRAFKEQVSAHPENISSGIGMGHHDEGIAQVGCKLDRIAKVSGRIHGSDATCWDLNVTREWELLDGARRAHLALEGLAYYEWSMNNRPLTARQVYFVEEVIAAEAVCNSAHVVACGKDLIEVMKFGCTASGVLTTSSQNSFMRQMLARLAGAEQRLAVGDDLVSSPMDVQLMNVFGVKTKGEVQVSGPDGPIDLTSHRFTKKNGHWHAKFLNLGKMIAAQKLKEMETGKKPAADAIGGCLFNLRHCPEEAQIFRNIADQQGWNTDVEICEPLETE